eukprot:scaffold128_cov248-Pinguiococcus_pyrenoidosus.AAC.49
MTTPSRRRSIEDLPEQEVVFWLQRSKRQESVDLLRSYKSFGLRTAELSKSEVWSGASGEVRSGSSCGFQVCGTSCGLLLHRRFRFSSASVSTPSSISIF